MWRIYFFQTPTGRKCSQCGYEMVTKPEGEKGGRGKRCSNCGEFKVLRDERTNIEKCSQCGATYRG